MDIAKILSNLLALGYTSFLGDLHTTEELEEIQYHLYPVYPHVALLEIDPLMKYLIVNNKGKSTVLKLVDRRLGNLRILRANAAMADKPLLEFDRELERLNKLVTLLRFTQF